MALLASHHNAVGSMAFAIVLAPLTRSLKPPPPSLLSTLPIVQACSKRHLGQDLFENLRTLYLFTKSDLKTILLPVVCFDPCVFTVTLTLISVIIRLFLPASWPQCTVSNVFRVYCSGFGYTCCSFASLTSASILTRTL